MLRIDAHQHFWQYDPVRDAWIDDSMEVIRHNFMPEDLLPLLQTNGIDGCIAVQADQSEKETQFLLGLAKENPEIKAVVGWVDLCADNVEERLAYYNQFGKLRGFRHILQAEKNGFMLQSRFKKGISLLHTYGYTYDVLVYANQLTEAIELVTAFPEQVFVLDHIAKPAIRTGEISDWSKQIRKLAARPNVNCKISGLVTEADWKEWKETDFTPYLDTVVEAFGMERILYGSDWPVCLLAANYETNKRIVSNYFSTFTTTDQAMFFGGNAMRCYQLSL